MRAVYWQIYKIHTYHSLTLDYHNEMALLSVINSQATFTAESQCSNVFFCQENSVSRCHISPWYWQFSKILYIQASAIGPVGIIEIGQLTL